jgi:ATP-dependent Lon protease
MQEIIEKYTREAGVRNLRRRFSQIIRKVAKKLLENPELKKVSITSKNLKEFLDKTVFEIDEIDGKNQIGVVNGLAWTSVGGDVLKVEAVKIRGKGVMQITGSLGDVMKESARIAHTVVKGLIDREIIKIDSKLIPLTTKEKEDKITPKASEIYNRFDLHLHVPEGATPKDGPSAGITISTAIASILSQREIRNDIAMTGEVRS